LIASDCDSPKPRGTRELHLVRCSQQPFVRDGYDTNVPAPKSGNDAGVDAFVGIQLKRQLRDLQSSTARPARVFQVKLCDESTCLQPLAADRLLVVVVVRERCVNIGQAQMGMCLHDLVRRHRQVLHLARDLTDFDIGARYDRAPTGVVDMRGERSGGFHGEGRNWRDGGQYSSPARSARGELERSPDIRTDLSEIALSFSDQVACLTRWRGDGIGCA